ncbi:cellulase family glycosylhydrolase [Methylobacterium sp. Leaf466]|uniref:glycoside hydrolase family 5 protein n=1 Tax=Methylobacterium sp. Leaf466 TaxID=1736386 RepID=UPI0006F3F830|nr:cellulase family glycosylhydrolase [Methylobacterium sp. Leaf466]KQT78208.1 hypothetical protein ASG59_09505 [Methylobacterium sp. Leaf466]
MSALPSRRAVLLPLAGLACLAPAVLSAPAPAQPASAIPVFRRGIGVSHAMGWAEVAEDGSYADPPFSGPRFRFDGHQRRAIRAAGFDFVRLAVDVGPFLAADAARRARIDRFLVETVEALLDDGLGVVVDLHPSDMHPAYTPTALTGGAAAPGFLAYLGLVTRTAANLAALVVRRRPVSAPRLAFELMNEPEVSQAAWQPMLEAAYRAARQGAATLPLVLGGGEQNAAASLEALDLRPFVNDPAVLYTFHSYEPWQFTHQGVQGNPAFPFDAVPYPAPATPQAMERATAARIAGLRPAAPRDAAAAADALRRYSRSGFDRAALDAIFRRVSAWRQARKLPAHAILLGEFGVRLTPYLRTDEGAAARTRWLHDMRNLAEEHGFAWAAWTYVGSGGFALAEDEVGPGFDPATGGALGLTASAAKPKRP